MKVISDSYFRCLTYVYFIGVVHANFLYGQDIPQVDKVFLSTSFAEVTSIQVGDFNKDNKQDILWYNRENKNLNWLRQEENLAFSSPINISNSCEHLDQIFVFDYNEDGYNDIIGFSKLRKKVVWFENQILQFSFEKLLLDSMDADKIAIINVNGELKLVTIDNLRNEVSYCSNIREGSQRLRVFFSLVQKPEQIICPQNVDQESLCYVLDGYDQLYRFSKDTLIKCSKYPLKFDLARGFDWNQDHIEDLVFTDYRLGELYVAFQDSSGIFGEKQRVHKSIYGLSDLKIADLNSDQQAEIVCVSKHLGEIYIFNLIHQELSLVSKIKSKPGLENIFVDHNEGALLGNRLSSIFSFNEYEDNVYLFEQKQPLHFSLHEFSAGRLSQINQIRTLDVNSDRRRDILFTKRNSNHLYGFFHKYDKTFSSPQNLISLKEPILSFQPFVYGNQSYINVEGEYTTFLFRVSEGPKFVDTILVAKNIEKAFHNSGWIYILDKLKRLVGYSIDSLDNNQKGKHLYTFPVHLKKVDFQSYKARAFCFTYYHTGVSVFEITPNNELKLLTKIEGSGLRFMKVIPISDNEFKLFYFDETRNMLYAKSINELGDVIQSSRSRVSEEVLNMEFYDLDKDQLVLATKDRVYIILLKDGEMKLQRQRGYSLFNICATASLDNDDRFDFITDAEKNKICIYFNVIE